MLLGTAALAEKMEGKPGTSGGEASKAAMNVKQQSGEAISHNSIHALSIGEFEQQKEKGNVKNSLIWGEALEKEDLGQQGRNEKLYYN